MPIKIVKTIEAFEFDELNRKAKEKVLHDFQESMWDFYAEEISQAFEWRLNEAGYDVSTRDIRWSLSHSQGDGVAWYTDKFDIYKLVQNLIEDESVRKEVLNWREDVRWWDNGNRLSIERRHIGNYNHYNTMYVKCGSESLNWFAELVEADIKRLSKEFEKLGYDMIDQFNSEDYFKENMNDIHYYDSKGNFVGYKYDFDNALIPK